MILNWNNAGDTIDCIKSLMDSVYQYFVPVVVDNGSSDGSVGEIQDTFPDIEMILLESNLGYAEGNNSGIRHALQSGADYVMVLNNDTLVDPGMLGELVALAESNQKIGMVGPLMHCFQPKEIVFARGSFINWQKGETFNREMFQPLKSPVGELRPERVDFIAGCGVLVSREFIQKAGYLDPKYYLNYEDVDWGVRAQREGFEVWYTPSAVLWHKISATLGQASPTNTYYTTRNALLFFWKNSPSRYRFQALILIFLRTMRTIGAWTFKPRYWSESYKKLRTANILALRDFSLGQFGRIGEKDF